MGPQPQPGSPPALPRFIICARGPVDLRANHARSPAAAAPAAGRGGERPPACPSALGPPGSAVSRGSRSVSLDRGPGAWLRPAPPPPRAPPRRRSRGARSPEPREPRAWGHTPPRDRRAVLSDLRRPPPEGGTFCKASGVLAVSSLITHLRCGL